MAVKDRLLQLLENDRGGYLSGERIASALGVTRGAVWKAIRSLQEDGYPIHGIPNRGYCLSPEADVLSAAGIGRYLSPENAGLKLEVYKTIDSTNTALKQRALDGAPAGLVLLAEEQSAGRGRRGRSFHSPRGTGIYMSILLRPDCPAAQSVLLTAAAAAATAQALEDVSGQPAQIKWVNDVRMHGKKVCGILTEASMSVENGGLDYIIVGIGINAVAPSDGFPEELRQIASSVFMPGEQPRDVRNRLAAQVLNRLLPYCAQPAQKDFLPEYRKRLFFLGREITVLSPQGCRQAVALDVDDDCRLVIQEPDGSVSKLFSGEISIQA